MAQKPTKEETVQRKNERLSSDIDRGRKKIVIKGPEPEIEPDNKDTKDGE